MATPTGRGLPEKIGHYKIVSELGRGGMGVVYKGYEESLNRYVAIKVLGDHLAGDEQFLSRFTREARAAGGLSHPNVIPIFYIGNDDGLHYFAMEFVNGRSVQSMIRAEGRVGNPRAAQIILQAAHGLAAAHDAGIIHRDIKPANLMVDERGVVKIADFGVALPAESATKLTATGALMGTPGYLSPEHCTGEPIDHRADIYALGVTYYEMLAGRMPFNAESPLALLRQILQEDPPDITQLNNEVDADSKRILMKMIARDRNQRYQSCHEIVADLEEYLASRNVRSVTASLATRSTAAPGAAQIATVMVGAETAAAALAPTLLPSPSPSPSMAVTAPEIAPIAQPVTQPGQQQQYVPPPAPPKKSSSFTLVAVIAVLAFVAAVAAAGVLGLKMWHNGKSFFSASKESTASVIPATTTSSSTPKSTTPGDVELSNRMPNALDTAAPSTPVPMQTASSGGQAPTPVQPTVQPAPARTGEAPILHGNKTPVKVAQVTQALVRQPQPQPQPVVARRNNVAVAVQGESALNSAIAQALTTELSSAGFEVANADDMPATEGIAGNASSGALVSRLRGHAGILVVARIEPAGERELHYMGRTDTAYTSRINVVVYDVASGNPIGTRGSGSIEYTSLNAQQKAEQVIGPLADKAVEAIKNH